MCTGTSTKANKTKLGINLALNNNAVDLPLTVILDGGSSSALLQYDGQDFADGLLATLINDTNPLESVTVSITVTNTTDKAVHVKVGKATSVMIPKKSSSPCTSKGIWSATIEALSGIETRVSDYHACVSLSTITGCPGDPHLTIKRSRTT